MLRGSSQTKASARFMRHHPESRAACMSAERLTQPAGRYREGTNHDIRPACAGIDQLAADGAHATTHQVALDGAADRSRDDEPEARGLGGFTSRR